MNAQIPCSLCVDSDIPELCFDGHTEATIRLAYALARYVQGADAGAEKALWYIDDAVAVAESVQEGDGWEINGGQEGSHLTDDDNYVVVNGTDFWLDPNGETGTTLTAAAHCDTCGQRFPDEDEAAIHSEEVHGDDWEDPRDREATW